MKRAFNQSSEPTKLGMAVLGQRTVLPRLASWHGKVSPLPNIANISLTAEQEGVITNDSGREVVVVLNPKPPADTTTKTPQRPAAMVNAQNLVASHNPTILQPTTTGLNRIVWLGASVLVCEGVLMDVPGPWPTFAHGILAGRGSIVENGGDSVWKKMGVPWGKHPVIKETLNEHDLNKIMNTPNLRHDINFDPDLHFQPNLDGEEGRRKKATKL